MAGRLSNLHPITRALLGAWVLVACDGAPIGLGGSPQVGGSDAGLGAAGTEPTGNAGGAAGTPNGASGAGGGNSLAGSGGASLAGGGAGGAQAGSGGSSTTSEVTPLFTLADAINPPVISVRPDGVIVTRAAGRVRNRHEKEQTFAEYTQDYFENRTHGIVIEDFTPTGEDRIRVTYLPLAPPQSDSQTNITSWRAWKMEGDNNTFLFNSYFPSATEQDVPPEAVSAPHAAVFQIEEISAPAGRSFAMGETFEFELSLWIDPASLQTANTRNAFYTDTFRYAVGVGGLTPSNRDHPYTPGPVPAARLGGATTIGWVLENQELYLEQVALNVQHENVQNFVEGRRLFHTDFITGEHSELGSQPFTEHANQAGPLYATTACTNCHLRNGSGTTVDQFSESTSMEFKLYDSGDLGDQLQLQEGTASLSSTETKHVMLGDGTSLTLSKPIILVTTNSGTVGGYSARVAPRLVGLGLLESIPEQSILALADPIDLDGDGISGRPVLVQDAQTGDVHLGRFGWKAEVPSVEQEASRALAVDLGVGTSLDPDTAGDQELSDGDLSDLVTYLRLLGVPPRREIEDPEVERGEFLFTSIGCASCHVTDVVTGGNHPFAELRKQSIKPYTDLLLHDMGPDLADDSGIAADYGPNMESAPPSASEWRTPPLWGIGLASMVNPDAHFLHDGRAATILEAILWHGGEAQVAADRFVALPKTERDALLAFLGSL